MTRKRKGADRLQCPPSIERALTRADNASWAAGKEERAKHIKALETQNREAHEDYLEELRNIERKRQPHRDDG